MNYKINIIIITFLIFNSSFLIAQVGINDNNASPDASAMLDVKSTTKGMLIPRMTTTERNAISSPATGLMIYNTSEGTFNYYNGSFWQSINVGLPNGISDADNDTKIQVEKTADEDSIRFDILGSERLVLRRNNNGLTMISLPNNESNVFIGEEAGNVTTSNGNRNIFIGRQAGYSNTTGQGNFFMGNRAGYSSSASHFNVFLGIEAGFKNTTGNNNLFIGSSTGYENTTGKDNLFIGNSAGHFNTTGQFNTYLGTQAGLFNSTGSNNTFIGYQAGMNETGSNKLYIDNSNTTTPLLYGEFDNKLLQINGTLKVVDGNQGAGKVLVSDASGQAAWTNLSEISNSHDTTQPTAIKYRGYLLYVHPTDNASGVNWATAKTTCSNLTAFGKSDWYLPSRNELNAMYKQSYLVAGLSETEIIKYWSSTAKDATYAFTQRLDYGGPDPDVKTDTSGHNCRCVRKN